MAPRTKALAVEAADEKVVKFEYDGQPYEVEKDMLEDLDILEQFEENKVVKPIRSLLGEAQWATFKSKRRSAKDLSDIAEAMFNALGVTTGE